MSDKRIYVILAGGKAVRAGGIDKGSQIINGRTFYERIVDEIGSDSKIVISANNEVPCEGVYDRVTDQVDNRGPLMAMYSAMMKYEAKEYFFIPCDMPYFNKKVIEVISSEIEDYECAVCKTTDGQVHPLCGLYRKSCIDVIADMIRENELRVRTLVDRTNSHVISTATTALLDDYFININSVADMEKNKKISVEHAIDILNDNVKIGIEYEECSIYKAAGKVLYETIYAEYDNPPFDRSPVDGYALRHQDIEYANKEIVKLKVAGKIYAGDDGTGLKVVPGETIKIMTGAIVPKGTTCIVMQEDTDCGEDIVCINRQVREGSNICRRGEDIRKGQVIAKKGQILNAACIAAIASQGIDVVKVYRRVSVAIIVTGDEINSSNDIRLGKICDINGPMIASRLAELNIDSVVIHVADNREDIARAINNAIPSSQCIITTGGVSVGEKDYIKECISDMGARILYHGIKMRPGSPMLAAMYRDRLILSLSGNPHAAMVTLDIIGVHPLLKMSGVKIDNRKSLVRMTDDYNKVSPVRRYLRGYEQDGYVRMSKGEHSSGAIMCNMDSNCYIDIEAGNEGIKRGEYVQVVYPVEYKNYIDSDKTSKRIVAVCGVKNSGKTTFICEMIKLCVKRGIKVAAIKHDGHDFEADAKGSDSSLFSQAGAVYSTVYSSTKRQTVERRVNIEIEDIIRECQEADIIFVEGLKNSKYRKIELVRADISDSIVSNKTNLMMICTDCHGSLDEDIEHIGLTQYDKVLDRILE